MGKKKKNKDSTKNYLENIANGNLSISFSSASDELNAIKEQLEKNNVSYSIGELPTMKDGKVVGCTRTITVTDSEALYKAIHRTSEISYEGAE